MEKSCGAVLFTERGGKRHYVLVSSTIDDNCGLPKGHMESGETEEETALREIWEETRVRAEILPGFYEAVEYMMPNGSRKRAAYFAARFDGQEAKINPLEHFDVLALPFEEALLALTYDSMKEILISADRWLEQLRIENDGGYL